MEVGERKIKRVGHRRRFSVRRDTSMHSAIDGGPCAHGPLNQRMVRVRGMSTGYEYEEREPRSTVGVEADELHVISG